MSESSVKAREWKRIPWAPDYEVSSDGLVASWKPIRNYAPAPTQRRLLSFSRDKDGYAKVVIFQNNGSRKTCRVCRLVAEVWHGVPTSEQVVRHLDGNNQNDSADNLKWGTPAENSNDAKIHKTWVHGQRVNTCKLNEPQVLEALNTSTSHSELARKFNVSVGAIWHIRNKRSWKHVGT
jgi:hypothetical protein